jgi:uncharacterized damage-inducible protein DinB
MSDTQTSQTTETTAAAALGGERADLLDTLAKHRFLLRFTARELTDEQAATRSTVSALCVGGLIKHVARTERSWMRFAQGDVEALGAGGPDEHAASFEMLPGETLAGLLEQYDEVARGTDALVAGLPDLDQPYPLPPAPWFEPGARWSVRRVLLHLIAETSQHAGHADLVREAIDGSKSMG